MQPLHQVREVTRLAQSPGFTVDGEVVLAISDSHGYGGLSFEVAEQHRTDRGGEIRGALQTGREHDCRVRPAIGPHSGDVAAITLLTKRSTETADHLSFA